MADSEYKRTDPGIADGPARDQPLIVIGPLPPPTHGVAVSTGLVLANRELRERFASVEHLDTSDHRTRGNIGRWDVINIALALRHLLAFVLRLRGRRGIVYLPLSQNLPGFLRDSLFIQAAALMGWRVAAHLRGSEFRSLFYERQGRLARAWIQFTLGRLAAVAVPGHTLRCVFTGLIPPERVGVVPNGTVDPKTNGVAAQPGDVLFLSSLRRRKGLMEALRAADLVLERNPAARFIFVGNWESEQVEREARGRASRWGQRIEFRDAVTGSAKDALMASSWVFLFPPTLPEGHTRVVLEALAAGVPVVTTNRGAIPETIVDGECGFILTDPEPQQIAERLLRLLGDHELRARMSHAARRRFLECYTQERADRWIADWLEEIAGYPAKR